MKKIALMIGAALLIALVIVTITLSETGLRRSNETIERIDRHIEMYEGSR